MTKLRELLDDAEKELQDDLKFESVQHLKERLRELGQAKRVVERLEKQLEDLLEKNVFDVSAELDK